jgi:hypothetical protein
MKLTSAIRIIVLAIGIAVVLFSGSEYLMHRSEVHAQTTFFGYIYVSTSGSDSNNGFSPSTPKATLAGAMSAISLQSCTAKGVKGDSTTQPCGHIILGIGNWTMGSPVNITSPFISISGQSPTATQIDYTGTGCAIVVNGADGPGGEFQPGVLEDFSIIGDNNTNTGACGIQSENNSSINIRNVSISDFPLANDSCLLLSAGTSFNERNNIGPVWLGNCASGWSLTTPTISGQSVATLGYGQINLFINVKSGQPVSQTAVSVAGTSTTSALVAYDDFHIVVNSDGNSGTTCANFKYALWVESHGVWQCDGNFGNGFVLDSNSKVSLGGFLNTGGTNTIPSGAWLWSINTTGWPGNSWPFTLYYNGAHINFQTPVGNTSNWVNFPAQSGTVTLH